MKIQIKKEKSTIFLWLTAAVDLVILVVCLVLLGNLQQKAKQAGVLNTQAAQISASAPQIYSLELDKSQEKITKLRQSFIDAQGMIAFISIMDGLKAGGDIDQFSFVSEAPLSDSTGQPGLPYYIEFGGSSQKLGQTLQRINTLPYMQRALSLEITKIGPQDFRAKYGAIIYVDQNFTKN